jgi:DNA-binding transcriptional MerR regulator
MYSIGTFSKLVDVSVKTLRYYHEIDLLNLKRITVITVLINFLKLKK